ncbi:hypothetical protein J7L02_02660 [Candidatus Woesearchaeota archaeon]|nr:hypothetical protein [Candidatus Woesearchaeota archaeon]
MDKNQNLKTISKTLILLTTLIIIFSGARIAFAADQSTIEVSPNIVPADQTLNFTVTVTNLVSSEHPIHEFRIYEHDNFTNIICFNKTGWNGPYYLENNIGKYCQWNAITGNLLQPGQSTVFHFQAHTPETECCRTWRMESRHQINENQSSVYTVYNDICIDLTPPQTSHSFLGPQKHENGVTWIDGVTQVNLTAIDPAPHPAGVNKTYYRYFLVDDAYCSGTCNFYNNDSISFQEYTSPFTIPDESCHQLQYYSTDLVGNEEDVEYTCFFVDKTAPIVQLSNITGPHAPAGSAAYYVSPKTNLTFTCQDQPPHPSGGERFCFQVIYDGNDITASYCDDLGGSREGEYCCVDAHNQPVLFKFHENEDSYHKLHYFCHDAVNKSSSHTTLYFRVDSQPPVINKTMFGTWLGDCPPENPGDECYVKDDGTSGVNITVTDEGECAVDDVTCTYELYWMGQLVDSGSFTNFKHIIFYNDSTHVLNITCEDGLGNTVTDSETFLVDSTPPNTVKQYGQPLVSDGLGHEWITSQTPIWFNASDAKSGVNATYYMITLFEDGESPCSNPYYQCIPMHQPGEGNWTLFTGGNITIPEQSCHLIEFYSVDNLGNVEPVQVQCPFVDNTPPNVGKEIGEPKVVKNNQTFITTQTEISLNCVDPEPHPVDQVTLYYRYRVSDDCSSWGNWTEWFVIDEPDVTFTFPEDSCHELQYYCEDALHNTGEIQSEIDIVDSQAPIINKTIIGPQHGQCPPENESDVCYVDNATLIHIEAFDPEPHPVNDVVCDWWYQVQECNGTSDRKENVIPPFDIQLPEECENSVGVICRDALNNTVTEIETFFADHTPPTTSIHLGQPRQGPGKCGKCYTTWINNQTPIWFTAFDGPACGDSRVKNTYYRITLVNDEACLSYQACQNATGQGNWSVYTGDNITIPEESCHLIEYHSVDNVEKTEQVKKKCVFVDNTGPEPNKTVGEPREVWDGNSSVFYPWISERCWSDGNDSLECWKVTMMTPISLKCVDPEPHPVDNSKVCFYVELDGDDWTRQYCNRFGRRYFNESGDGYCCVPYELYGNRAFKFNEETEHRLKYYCKDALGNKGPVDEEFFKVEGVLFRLHLFKKWNLISVPFVLFNDSPEAVFGELEGIESVWTYDPETGEWLVWSPGDAPDTLHHITPGWGYWVFETLDHEVKTLGGSLFQTGPNLPPSRVLKPGWNLIGIYGVGSRYHGFRDYCSYRVPWYGNFAYCALASLIDPTIGFPLWSSLVGYRNCGHHTYHWEYLGPEDWVSIGRGYWIEMDREDIYAPTTYCPWMEWV